MNLITKDPLAISILRFLRKRKQELIPDASFLEICREVGAKTHKGYSAVRDCIFLYQDGGFIKAIKSNCWYAENLYESV